MIDVNNAFKATPLKVATKDSLAIDIETFQAKSPLPQHTRYSLENHDEQND